MYIHYRTFIILLRANDILRHSQTRHAESICFECSRDVCTRVKFSDRVGVGPNLISRGNRYHGMRLYPPLPIVNDHYDGGGQTVAVFFFNLPGFVPG